MAIKIQAGLCREGTTTYKGVEFGTEISVYRTYTSMKYTFVRTYNCNKPASWALEDFTIPNWCLNNEYILPLAIKYIKFKEKRAKEALYKRLLETTNKIYPNGLGL